MTAPPHSRREFRIRAVSSSSVAQRIGPASENREHGHAGQVALASIQSRSGPSPRISSAMFKPGLSRPCDFKERLQRHIKPLQRNHPDNENKPEPACACSTLGALRCGGRPDICKSTPFSHHGNDIFYVAVASARRVRSLATSRIAARGLARPDPVGQSGHSYVQTAETGAAASLPRFGIAGRVGHATIHRPNHDQGTSRSVKRRRDCAGDTGMG